MGICDARLTEIQMQAGGRLAAWIDCPPAAIPAAGQYVHAYAPGDSFAALGAPLFRGEVVGRVGTVGRGFLAAPPLPPGWAPGTFLVLRGPLGRGFSLDGQRLALAALGDTVTRLLPLAGETLQRGDAVTLFTNAPLPDLPASIEIYPLGSLPEALTWADCLAIDLPLKALAGLRASLGLKKGDRLSLPAQALVFTPMPCGGLAECGACAVPTRWSPGQRSLEQRSLEQRRYRLACKDGPVFNLDELDW
jgi:NAD(P)H-flavin reductase